MEKWDQQEQQEVSLKRATAQTGTIPYLTIYERLSGIANLNKIILQSSLTYVKEHHGQHRSKFWN